MPLVEIEDARLAQLQEMERRFPQAANFEKVWTDILADPKLRNQAQRLVKEKFPHVAIPEIDAADAASKPILDEMEKLRKELAEHKEAVEKEREERDKRETERNVTRTIADAHNRLRSQGWDDEGIKAIEEEMQKRGVGDYDLVANFLKSQQPKPAPLNASYEGRDLNWFNPGEDEPDGKLLMENPQKFKSDMLKKFFADKANGNLAGWAA